jgi:hypothetical protein
VKCKESGGCAARFRVTALAIPEAKVEIQGYAVIGNK